MRLIDADALRAKYQAILDRGDMFCEYDIIGMVDNAPTVDFEKLGESLRCQIRAEYGSCDDCELSCPRNELIKLLDSERPTGEWKQIDAFVAKCSVCGVESFETPFCPRCGADMRGKEAGNDV